ncbi:MAG: hypothetical protein ACRDQH_04600 [Pseudonocardiaceae bacterium]
MRKLIRWYGANPLHLLVLIASFGLAGYAADKLIRMDRPLAVVIWFVGAALIHDLILLPLYQLIDWPLRRIGRRQTTRVTTSWINYLRIPLLLSGLLLLVWFPSILRLNDLYHPTTNLSSSGFLGRWLLVTGVLFLISAVAYAVRLRRDSKAAPAKN